MRTATNITANEWWYGVVADRKHDTIELYGSK